jgi:hypothetical protein
MTHFTAAAINVLLLRQVSCSLKACNNNNNQNKMSKICKCQNSGNNRATKLISEPKISYNISELLHTAI